MPIIRQEGTPVGLWAAPEDTGARLLAEVERLVARLTARDDIDEVWLFGSALDGGVHATSDIDLFVVQRTELDAIDRALALRADLGSPEALDLFVFTPAEAAAGGRFPDHVRAHGRRLR